MVRKINGIVWFDYGGGCSDKQNHVHHANKGIREGDERK